MNNLNNIRFCIAMLLVLLTGCSDADAITQVVESTVSIQNEYTEKPGNISITTAAIELGTNTPSPFPTNCPELTFSVTPTIEQPTWTPLPTLSTEEAQAKVIDLLSNNAGCELPCWWGVMPGETMWDEAEYYFSSFINEIIKTELKRNAEDQQLVYSLVYILPNNNDTRITGFVVKDGVIDLISAKPGTELRYQVNNLLSLHGKPEEIILDALTITAVLKPWVSFYLYYPEQGIIAMYNGEATLIGEKIKMCPKGIGPKLILVPPGSMTLEEMIRESYSAPFTLPSITENPGWSIERFYEEMQDPEACFVVDPTR